MAAPRSASNCHFCPGKGLAACAKKICRANPCWHAGLATQLCLHCEFHARRWFRRGRKRPLADKPWALSQLKGHCSPRSPVRRPVHGKALLDCGDVEANPGPDPPPAVPPSEGSQTELALAQALSVVQPNGWCASNGVCKSRGNGPGEPTAGHAARWGPAGSSTRRQKTSHKTQR